MIKRFGVKMTLMFTVMAALLFGVPGTASAAPQLGEDTVGVIPGSAPVLVNFDNWPGNSWWGQATIQPGQVKGFQQPGAIDILYAKVPTGYLTRPGWCSWYQWDVRYKSERYPGAAMTVTTGTKLVLGGDAGGVATNIVSPAAFGLYTTTDDGTHVRIHHWDC